MMVPARPSPTSSRPTVEGETICADGTTIHHLEAGDGPVLVMLPGWSQSAQIFDRQLSGLSQARRSIAIDHRGHGASSAAASGYHLHRLVADLRDLLVARDLGRVHLLGHSMGCAVIWANLELFGPDGLASLIFVDQMPCVLRNPAWTDHEALDAGATMGADGLFAFTDALRDAAAADPRAGFLAEVTSPGMPKERLSWLVAQASTFDRRHAAELIFDVATQDWRPDLSQIELPTLVIAGDSVNVPLASQRWIGRQIPAAQFACVTAASGGTHFPFLENSDAFNAAVSMFLDRQDPGGS